MKIQLSDAEVTSLFDGEWEGFTNNEYVDIALTIPVESDEWTLPDEYVERIREYVKTLPDQSIYKKMEAQTIRGTLRIDLSQSYLEK